MTDNVRYIISKLFSLRAGLSLASTEKEELDKAESTYLENDKEYQDNLNSLRATERELKETKKEIEDERRVLARRSRRRNLLSLFFLVCAVAAAVLYFKEEYRLYSYGAAALAVIVPFTVSFIIAPRCKNYRKPNKALIRDLTKECKRLEKSIKQLDNEVKRLYPQHAELEAIYENEKTVRTLNVKDIYSSLLEQHGILLSPDYWQYADIMFYYFEAKKCEDMETCIALIDRLKASEFLESSSLKATHNLNLRSSKLLSSSKLYLSQEFATLALKIERRSSHYHDLVASNGLYNVMKSRLGANSQNLYEDMMKLINMA